MKKSHGVALSAALALSLLYVFWPLVSSGFKIFSSDRYDGFIEIAIMEHWWNAVRGLSSIREVEWFHPWPNTLAYNDGYLLHAVIYVPLRMIGFSPFVAVDLAQAGLRAAGFLAMFLIARRILRLPIFSAVLAAVLTTILPALVGELIHAQFSALGPAMMAVWLALESVLAMRLGRNSRAVVWGCCASVMYGAVLLSSFYVAWGVGLLFAASVLAVIIFFPRQTIAAFRPTLQGAVSFSITGATLVASLTPALILYLPVVRGTGLHSYAEARGYAVAPAGLVQLGSESIAWSWVGPTLRELGASDVAHGFAPLLLLTSVAGLALAYRRAYRGDATAIALLPIGASAVFLSLAAVDWGGLWLWSFIWHAVPGAKAFRVPSRILFLVAPILALLAAWLVSRVEHRSRTAAIILACLLVGEGLRHRSGSLVISDEMARVSALSAAPAACRTFIATKPREGTPTNDLAAIYSHNTEAMLIAAIRGMPTLNGFSTFNPPGWDLARPQAPDYLNRALREADRFDLRSGLCGVDFHALSWSGPNLQEPFPPLSDVPMLIPGHAVKTAASTPQMPAAFVYGWSELEPNGIWTNGSTARMRFRIPEDVTSGTVELRGRSFSKPGQAQQMRSSLGQSWTLQSADNVLRLPFSRSDLSGNILGITLHIAEPISPTALGIGDDLRDLGFGLQSVTLVAQ